MSSAENQKDNNSSIPVEEQRLSGTQNEDVVLFSSPKFHQAYKKWGKEELQHLKEWNDARQNMRAKYSLKKFYATTHDLAETIAFLNERTIALAPYDMHMKATEYGVKLSVLQQAIYRLKTDRVRLLEEG